MPFLSANYHCPLPSALFSSLAGPILDVPSIGPAAAGRANPVIRPGPVPGTPLALPEHQVPAGGCRLVLCAGRPFPELKVTWGQAHTH